METSPVHKLHDEEHLLVRLKSFVKFRNVRMVEFLHDFHLTLDALATIRLHQLDFFVDFDSNLLVEHLVETESDDSIGSLPESLPDKVVI